MGSVAKSTSKMGSRTSIKYACGCICGWNSEAAISDSCLRDINTQTFFLLHILTLVLTAHGGQEDPNLCLQCCFYWYKHFAFIRCLIVVGAITILGELVLFTAAEWLCLVCIERSGGRWGHGGTCTHLLAVWRGAVAALISLPFVFLADESRCEAWLTTLPNEGFGFQPAFFHWTPHH